MPRVDPRHEPGIGSLIVGATELFHGARGWVDAFGAGPFPWPELTAAGSHVTGDRVLRVAYSTTPLPGRLT